MAEQTIVCPKCGTEFPLSEAITTQIEREIQEDYQQKLDTEKKRAEKKAREALAVELADLREQLIEKETEISSVHQQELELRKREREIANREKAMAVELEDATSKAEEAIRAKLAEERRTKDLEHDKQLSDLRQQIEDLKRRAEQGSQQTQGEAIELELERVLGTIFSCDVVQPVPKGIRGADVLQQVYAPGGQHCGTIMWESKNTRNWSDGWIPKLKDDQRALGVPIAVLVSAVLPKGMTHFAYYDGVWITDVLTVPGVASALRMGLIEVAMARAAAVGKSEKMEMIYAYLSGTQFKQRVEGVVESFVAMKTDLDHERRAMESAWSKREKQIQRMGLSVAGLYGDVQGIIGGALPKIERLELASPAELGNQESAT